MEKKILSIKLERNYSTIDVFNPNRITGRLRINYSEQSRFKVYSQPVLENREFLFPEGIYEIKYEYSPKFNRKLWEFKDIPNRSEIKFHSGDIPSHSRGCPLLGHSSLAILHNLLDPKKTYYIHIKNN